MAFYDDMQALAEGLLREFKQGVVVLRQVTNAATANNDPNPGAESIALFPLNATVRGVSKAHIDGETITRSDLLVTCAVTGIPLPKVGKDFVVIDGQDHTIKQVNVVPAAGTPVAYQIFVDGP